MRKNFNQQLYNGYVDTYIDDDDDAGQEAQNEQCGHGIREKVN